MADAQRDQNFITIGMGVSSADGVTPLPLLVDAATGRLLIEITTVSDSAPVLPTAPAIRDANHTPVKMGINSSDLTTPLPLMTDNRNNLLYVDLLIE